MTPGPRLLTLSGLLFLVGIPGLVRGEAPVIVAIAGPVFVSGEKIGRARELEPASRLEVGAGACVSIRMTTGSTCTLTGDGKPGERSVLELGPVAEGAVLARGTLLFEVREGGAPLTLRAPRLRTRVLAGRGLIRSGPDRDFLGLSQGQLQVWDLATGSGYTLRGGHAAWFDARSKRPRPDHFSWGTARSCAETLRELPVPAADRTAPTGVGPLPVSFPYLAPLAPVRPLIQGPFDRWTAPLGSLSPGIRLPLIAFLVLAGSWLCRKKPRQGLPAILVALVVLEGGLGFSRRWTVAGPVSVPGGALMIGLLMLTWFELARGSGSGSPAPLSPNRWLLPRVGLLWLVGALVELGVPGSSPGALLAGVRVGSDPARALPGLAALPPLLIEVLALIVPLLTLALRARAPAGSRCESCRRELRIHERSCRVEAAEEAAIRSGSQTGGAAAICASVRKITEHARRPHLPVLRIAFSFCPACAVGLVILESDQLASQVRVRGEKQFRDLMALPT